MKYRKKPISVEAMQFTGVVTPELEEFLGEGNWTKLPGQYVGATVRIEVRTLEGWLMARPGDYIIKGVKGEVYPCKPNVFAATYERVGAESADELEREIIKAATTAPDNEEYLACVRRRVDESVEVTVAVERANTIQLRLRAEAEAPSGLVNDYQYVGFVKADGHWWVGDKPEADLGKAVEQAELLLKQRLWQRVVAERELDRYMERRTEHHA